MAIQLIDPLLPLRGTSQARALKTPMKAHQLKLFADYHQFHIRTEAAEGDLSDAWSPAAYQRMLALADGVIGIRTARDAEVSVTVEVLDSEPLTDPANFDHVAECSLAVASGPLVVAGCTDYLPDATRIDLMSGMYRVRVSASGFDTVSDDGVAGQDHYLVQLWQAPPIEPAALKQGTV